MYPRSSVHAKPRCCSELQALDLVRDRRHPRDLTAPYAALVDLDAVRDADATRAVEQAVHRVRAEREVIALGS
jgi:hypothetical protein